MCRSLTSTAPSTTRTLSQPRALCQVLKLPIHSLPASAWQRGTAPCPVLGFGVYLETHKTLPQEGTPSVSVCCSVIPEAKSSHGLWERTEAISYLLPFLCPPSPSQTTSLSWLQNETCLAHLWMETCRSLALPCQCTRPIHLHPTAPDETRLCAGDCSPFPLASPITYASAERAKKSKGTACTHHNACHGLLRSPHPHLCTLLCDSGSCN